MTPEERATQLLQSAKDMRDLGEKLTKAIKEAEQAVYEKAAKVVEELDTSDLSIAAPTFKDVYKAIAAKIRALSNDENKS